MKHALVIGGAKGQVASALAGMHDPDFSFEVIGRPEADLAQPPTLHGVIERTKPDIVICVGAYTAVDQAEKEAVEAQAINGDGPGVLASICARAGIPLIHLSTDYVFDGSKKAPYVETDTTNPLSVYGRSKLAGETAIRSAGGRHVILRITWVYAPEGKNFPRTMLRLAKTRDQLQVVEDQIGRPCYAPHVGQGVCDIARVLVRNADAPSGVFHMTASGEPCSWRDFAEAIFEGARARGGPSATVAGIPSSAYPTPVSRPANSVLDCSAVERAFGVVLPEWRTGLDECLDAIAARGWKVD